MEFLMRSLSFGIVDYFIFESVKNNFGFISELNLHLTYAKGWMFFFNFSHENNQNY